MLTIGIPCCLSVVECCPERWLKRFTMLIYFGLVGSVESRGNGSLHLCRVPTHRSRGLSQNFLAMSAKNGRLHDLIVARLRGYRKGTENSNCTTTGVCGNLLGVLVTLAPSWKVILSLIRESSDTAC
jgi:hypothetical protein